jgi:hypothetical protein
MFFRSEVTDTLTSIADQLNTPGVSWGGSTLGIRPHLTGEQPFFELERSGGNVEVPATAEGITQLADFANIPTKFAQRVLKEDPEFADLMFARLLRANPDNVTVQYEPERGIKEVYKPSTLRVEPRRVIENVMHVMDPNSPVVEWWNTNGELRIDTVVEPNASFGVGGDFRVVDGRKVGDITAGGVRVGLEQGHAPTVQPYLFRLACTNGYENYDDGLKVDARGATVEQVLADFERVANEAFGQVEAQIAAFYELQNQRIQGDVTQAVLRIADERGLPARTAHALAARVPEITDDNGGASMFDVVNLITNAANESRIRDRRPVRRTLETVGGALITEHAARCSHCQQKL